MEKPVGRCRPNNDIVISILTFTFNLQRKDVYYLFLGKTNYGNKPIYIAAYGETHRKVNL